MNTTAAALQANVAVATIRTWCRRGVITATKTAGRWIIDTASLATRITIGAMKRPARYELLDDVIAAEAAQAGYYSEPAALRTALKYVEARDLSAFIGPTNVRVSEKQWNDIAGFLRCEIANLAGEKRTQHAIYDYS